MDFCGILQSTQESGLREGCVGAESDEGLKIRLVVIDILGHLLALHVMSGNERRTLSGSDDAVEAGPLKTSRKL